MMTTQYPLVAALMELAWKLHAANVNLDLYWLRRLQNSEADALTNCQFSGFDPAKRCRIDIASYKGEIFHQMLVLGEGLYADIKDAKKKRLEKSDWRMKATRAKHETLRVRDPWPHPKSKKLESSRCCALWGKEL